MWERFIWKPSTGPGISLTRLCGARAKRRKRKNADSALFVGGDLRSLPALWQGDCGQRVQEPVGDDGKARRLYRDGHSFFECLRPVFQLIL